MKAAPQTGHVQFQRLGGRGRRRDMSHTFHMGGQNRPVTGCNALGDIRSTVRFIGPHGPPTRPHGPSTATTTPVRRNPAHAPDPTQPYVYPDTPHIYPHPPLVPTLPSPLQIP